MDMLAGMHMEMLVEIMCKGTCAGMCLASCKHSVHIRMCAVGIHPQMLPCTEDGDGIYYRAAVDRDFCRQAAVFTG